MRLEEARAAQSRWRWQPPGRRQVSQHGLLIGDQTSVESPQESLAWGAQADDAALARFQDHTTSRTRCSCTNFLDYLYKT